MKVGEDVRRVSGGGKDSARLCGAAESASANRNHRYQKTHGNDVENQNEGLDEKSDEEGEVRPTSLTSFQSS
jgi:hypothetical protein